MHASTVAIALFAASQTIAAPMPADTNTNSRSLSAIENFFSNLKRSEDLDARSLSAIENFFSNLKRDAPDARSISAIENFFSNLKRSEGIDARSFSAISNAIGDLAEDILGPTTAKRSLKAVGAAVAGGVASGVAGAIGNAVLNNKRTDSGLMVDTDTGVIYIDVPDANEGRTFPGVPLDNQGTQPINPGADGFLDGYTVAGRSLKAVGTAVAGGIASGVAGAIGNAVLNNKRSESGLMVDTDTGLIYMDVADANEARSLKAVGTAVAGGIASGVAGAVANDILNKRSLSAIENFINNLKRQDLEYRPASNTVLKPCKRSELEVIMAKRTIDDLE